MKKRSHLVSHKREKAEVLSLKKGEKTDWQSKSTIKNFNLFGSAVPDVVLATQPRIIRSR
jgi:hypothetical protein